VALGPRPLRTSTERIRQPPSNPRSLAARYITGLDSISVRCLVRSPPRAHVNITSVSAVSNARNLPREPSRMDDLDRLYRRLVQNIRTRQPEYLHIPFTVQELYEQLVPYRHNRRELAIETNQDYEIAVARLLSGERGYVQGNPEMQSALKQELASPTGNPGIFKDHAQTQISLTQAAATAGPTHSATPAVPIKSTSVATAPGSPGEQPADQPTTSAPEAPPSTTQDAPPPSAAVRAAYDTLAPSTAVPITAQPPSASLLSSLAHIDVQSGCRFCGGTLPEDRAVNYCPHCGENLKTQRCPACGAEMDTAWKFCVTCGRRAS
jgi:hypothetical protein